VHLYGVNDPREKDPAEAPVEAFKELAKGPLPEPFMQHYAAAFLAYWGEVPQDEGTTERSVSCDDPGPSA